MKVKYKELPFKFIDLLPLIIILAAFSVLIYVIALVTVTKNDVILNDNYRGTKILVKHYKPFNRDSIYLAYPKPVTNVMKITEVKDRKHLVVKFDNGERWRVRVTNADGYKVGQTIKSIKEYYPKEKSIIVGQEHTRWLEKLK